MLPSPRPVTVALHHVGCKLNQAEIEALAHAFGRRGYEVVPFAGTADVYVVNTCTVTGSGDADSRRAVRRALRVNPRATVVATGCYAQRRPDELRRAGAHLVVGNGEKARLLDHLDALLDGREGPSFDPADPPRTRTFLQIEGEVPGGRTRGTVQVQDGCDEHCTYCIIPKVRGRSVSRPVPEILTQARRMIASGYRELALTGVNTGSYGRDRGETEGLVQLVTELLRLDGLERLRLNSIEPGELSDALIDLAASSPRICRHFHVPLQSGDDAVLRRMGRRYTRAAYAGRVERLAAAIPDCAIGADVMVAFPGESDEAFANTAGLLTDLPLTYLHVFPYSQRADTAAVRLAGGPAPDVARTRVRQLIDLGDRKRLTFHRSFVGRRLRILVEDRPDQGSGMAVGLSDNYIKGLLSRESARPNELVDLQVTAAREDLVYGERAA
ncbi:MAG: tRNA (N(6)-L-threonylcarbamoyladenosine(37)-C(2))-methylthiotransferase MtaB [Candidatus Latescibacterota bacterium]